MTIEFVSLGEMRERWTPEQIEAVEQFRDECVIPLSIRARCEEGWCVPGWSVFVRHMDLSPDDFTWPEPPEGSAWHFASNPHEIYVVEADRYSRDSERRHFGTRNGERYTWSDVERLLLQQGWAPYNTEAVVVVREGVPEPVQPPARLAGREHRDEIYHDRPDDS